MKEQVIEWSESPKSGAGGIGTYIAGRIVVQVDKRAPFVVQYSRNINRRPTWSTFAVIRVGGTIGLSSHTRLFTELETIIQDQFRKVGIL